MKDNKKIYVKKVKNKREMKNEQRVKRKARNE